MKGVEKAPNRRTGIQLDAKGCEASKGGGRELHPEVRRGWEEVKRLLDGGVAVIVAGGEEYGLPSLHDFYPKRYYSSIEHCGFGFFEGCTERGKFSFDGGGAMRHFQGGEGEYLSYSPLRASAEVLEDLGYDLEAARARVDEILEAAQ